MCPPFFSSVCAPIECVLRTIKGSVDCQYLRPIPLPGDGSLFFVRQGGGGLGSRCRQDGFLVDAEQRQEKRED